MGLKGPLFFTIIALVLSGVNPAHAVHRKARTIPFENRFKNPQTYLTKKKDTLSKLAEALYSNRGRWEKLKAENPSFQHFGPNDLLGRGKKVHYLAPKIGASYSVQSRDTLAKISIWKYGNWKCWKNIYEDNKSSTLNPNLILPGTTLHLNPSCHRPLVQKNLVAKQSKKARRTRRNLSSTPDGDKASLRSAQFEHVPEVEQNSTPAAVHVPEILEDSSHTAGEISFGAGVALISFSQSGSLLDTVALTEVGPSFHFSGDHPFGKSMWRMMYSGSAIFPLFMTSPAGTSLTAIDADLKIAREFPISDADWFFRPGLGVNYLTSSASGAFGYSNFMGPEIYLGFNRNKGRNKQLSIGLKYTEIIHFGTFSSLFSSNSITLGIEYKLSKLGVFLNAGLTNFKFSPDNSLSATTAGIGINYGF